MEEIPGRRERKKRQTRDHIAGTALALFAERGFERVTVAEVARHADVAPATVFNHFATKEDLVYRGMEDFEAAMVTAVRTRPPDRSAAAAVGAFLAGTSRPPRPGRARRRCAPPPPPPAPSGWSPSAASSPAAPPCSPGNSRSSTTAPR